MIAMPYTKTIWVNDSPPSISAENLQKMETGIEDAHTALEGIDTAVAWLASYLSGLELVYDSANALTVTSGAAWIPSLARVVEVSAPISKTGLALTASAWHYIYLFDNAGVPDIEVSTTAPAAPYRGTARAKGADDSRRLIGAVLSDGAATPGMRPFVFGAERVIYTQGTTSGPYRVLSQAPSVGNTATRIDLSVIAPPALTTEVLATITVGGAAGFGSFRPSVSASGDRIGAVGLVAATSAQFPTSMLWTPAIRQIPAIYYTNGGDSAMNYWLDVYGYRLVR